VQWKPHGLSLKLKALHSTPERVRLELQTESSQLDPTRNPDLPAITANRIKTQIDADYGRPLFLSGLIKRQDSSSRAGLPFFSSLPLLGPLFGRDGTSEQHTELIAILLPSASPPSPPMPRVVSDFPHGKVPAVRNGLLPEPLPESVSALQLLEPGLEASSP
jgi:Flp pilus assembly secretin CpaC